MFKKLKAKKLVPFVPVPPLCLFRDISAETSVFPRKKKKKLKSEKFSSFIIYIIYIAFILKTKQNGLLFGGSSVPCAVFFVVAAGDSGGAWCWCWWWYGASSRRWRWIWWWKMWFPVLIDRQTRGFIWKKPKSKE